jgi:hypothetical protein
MSSSSLIRIWAVAGLLFISTGEDVGSETPTALNTFGMPGLINMPTAGVKPDGQLSVSTAFLDGVRKNTISFQITPRLTGAFRYSIIDSWRGGSELFDRSFDLQYRLIDEGRIRPEISVGLRDFIGTGVFSSEYIVASKRLSQNLAVSGGIGWGSLARSNSFENPLSVLGDRFSTRPSFTGLGGEVNTGQWFRGPSAVFAGVNWRASNRLTLLAEYASDNVAELSDEDPTEKNSFNFGLLYAARPGVTFGMNYLKGEELGFTAQFSLNPRNPPAGGDASPAPTPFYIRSDAAESWSGFTQASAMSEGLRKEALKEALAQEGLILEQISFSQRSVSVRIRNTRFDAVSQAIGRAARVLSWTMPHHIEQFHIEPVENGVAMSKATLQRSELERLEYKHTSIEDSLLTAEIGSSDSHISKEEVEYERFMWGVSPFLGLALFDPDNPLRADLGVQADARLELMESLSVSGVVRAKLIGNRNESVRASTSILPHVRSDQPLYDRGADIWLERLTVDHFGKLGPDIYTRLSFGYLEEMFGGVSAEALWKPVSSRLGLGIELNYAMQRNTDKLLGFDEYNYDVATGHLSAYYAFSNGFDLQLDVGRYLAGDWGTTISVDRRFRNGWSVGAFATLTDVSFEDFGEGSFDKGIRITVPVSWFLGKPHRSSVNQTIRSVQRDGGARLNLHNRLYDIVRPNHEQDLVNQWGRFWR